ncbi:MAG: hypothetical protein L0229_30905 [Blastocatellia bacterium]|nr:hypothetical protein [Blastocatellia bacterium]
MSEYQYYEFHAIDQPLSEEDQAYMRQLSSRVQLSRYQAIFTYSYGDFRGDKKKVLEKYFDALLYLANWGTKQLMFRLPRSIVDAEQFAPYCIHHKIAASVTSDYVILDIDFYEEEGGFWLEGEGWLSSLAPIRRELLRGDFRVLYLAWLKAIQRGEDEEDFEDYESEVEPPVPPNLAHLSPALKTFVKLFEIDEDLIAVARTASATEADAFEPQIEKLVASLPEKERNDLLVRVVRGEPNMDSQLMKRLRERAGTTLPPEKQSAVTAAPRRKVSELLAAAEERTRQRREEERRKAERARIRRLEELAQKEGELWKQVFALIAEKKTKAYEEAVKILVDLRDVADHFGHSEHFESRISQIHEDYSRLSGLTRRLDQAGLKKYG